MSEARTSSTPGPEPVRRSRPPPPLSPARLEADAAPADDAEPESRAPALPPAPVGSVAAVPRRGGGNGTVRMMPRGGPTGTVRMWAPGTGPSAERDSLVDRPSGERRSRLSAIRQSLLSALPPIPKSLAAMGGPLVVFGLVALLAVVAVVWMGMTGRLPPKMAAGLGFAPPTPEAPAFVPPPLPENAVLADELVGPSASPGRANVGRAVLSIPKTFTAGSDGAFDLVVHFHGNTELVLESYEVALLDTVVLVVNLGNGSGVYEDTYANPEQLERVLSRVPEIVEKRGLSNAHLRRVALTGWSAGYGAILRALAHPAHAERVDAVVLLDGLHTSYLPGTQQIDDSSLGAVLAFAERAKRGERLFVLTHSSIRPEGYLGVRETTNHLLEKLGLERHPVETTTTIPPLAAAVGVLPKADLRPLELESEVRAGGLVVRGFRGDQAAHHISHLMQMSSIALPELAKRWAPR